MSILAKHVFIGETESVFIGETCRFHFRYLPCGLRTRATEDFSYWGPKLIALIEKKSQYCTNKAIISFNALLDFVKFFLPTSDYIVLI